MKLTTKRLGVLLASMLATGTTESARAQAPVIASFGSNGALVCTNLQAGSVAVVESAPAVTGPWTNTWAGLDAAVADTNGTIRVSVPMFYRVRGTPGTNTIPHNMALIPAGSFVMGNCMDPAEGNANNPELPRHTNQVSAFYRDQYLVTKALWDEVYNWAIAHGYTFDNAGFGKATNHPVHTVSWYDAVKWCNARSEKEGRTPAYYTDAALTVRYRFGQTDPFVNWVSRYRLPTEAEWEKAARGGASGHRFPWTAPETIPFLQANFYSDPHIPYCVSPIGWNPIFEWGDDPNTSPVGYFAPNGYGLYDMAGNVFEWCWDWCGLYSSAPQTDPHGPPPGNLAKVVRGGSWADQPPQCRVAARGAGGIATSPDGAWSLGGFRCVLPLK